MVFEHYYVLGRRRIWFWNMNNRYAVEEGEFVLAALGFAEGIKSRVLSRMILLVVENGARECIT